MKKTFILSTIASVFISTMTTASAQSMLEAKLVGVSSASAHSLLRAVSNKLPVNLLNTLPRNLKIEVKSLNSARLTQVSCTSSNARTRFGYFNKMNNTLTLDTDLVALYGSNAEAATVRCPHATVGAFAEATVAHELFHSFDKETKFSDENMFKAVSQWHGKGNQFNGKRSPDMYEQKNIEEYAAVNFEHFLLDPEYKCRRPSHYNYYKTKLGISPSTMECREPLSVYDLSSGAPLRSELNPARIYEVHYLVSGPGSRMDNKFGHAMLRLIGCAPERVHPLTHETIPATLVGPECLKDVDYHQIVSFSANVEDLTINNFRGLIGDYPSILTVTPFSGKAKETNQKGLRDLFSYPLKLTQVQKANLVTKITETLWDYSGSYRFLNNNCATETYDLLQASLYDDRLFTRNSIRPTQVGVDLMNLGYIDTKYTEIETMGLPYFYKSQAKLLGQALEALGEPHGKLPKDIFAFAERNEAGRTKVLEKLEAEFEANPESFRNRDKAMAARKQLSSLFLLEVFGINYLFGKIEKQMSDKAMEMRDQLMSAEELQKYISGLKISNQTLVPQSYGIPFMQEFEQINVDQFKGAQEDLHAYILEHKLVDLEGAKDQTHAIEDIIKRTSALKEKIQRLNLPGAP